MSKTRYENIMTMTITEEERKQKPTSQDYKNAANLLKDFQIRCKIPECSSVAELDNYIRMRIRNRLCGVKRT